MHLKRSNSTVDYANAIISKLFAFLPANTHFEGTIVQQNSKSNHYKNSTLNLSFQIPFPSPKSNSKSTTEKSKNPRLFSIRVLSPVIPIDTAVPRFHIREVTTIEQTILTSTPIAKETPSLSTTPPLPTPPVTTPPAPVSGQSSSKSRSPFYKPSIPLPLPTPTFCLTPPETPPISTDLSISTTPYTTGIKYFMDAIIKYGWKDSAAVKQMLQLWLDGELKYKKLQRQAIEQMNVNRR